MDKDKEVLVSFSQKELATIMLIGSLGASVLNRDAEHLFEAMDIFDAAEDAPDLWESAMHKMELAVGISETRGMVS